MTADGKIATSNRAVTSFGSARDLRNLYALRATADAVLCGARTLEMDAATLGEGSSLWRRKRIRAGLAPHHLRIIVSGRGTLDPQAKVFSVHTSPIILLTTRQMTAMRRRRFAEKVDEIKVGGSTEINWPATLSWLRERWGVRRLLCEGGSELNASLLRASCVDEIHLTLCPLLFGGRQAPTLADGSVAATLLGAAHFEWDSLRRVGRELFVVLRRSKHRRKR